MGNKKPQIGHALDSSIGHACIHGLDWIALDWVWLFREHYGLDYIKSDWVG